MTGPVTIGDLRRIGTALIIMEEEATRIAGVSLPVAAFAAGRLAPGDDGTGKWVNWTPFSYPFNLTQQPAASVPCGFTKAGLPAGLHIVGRMFDDAAVLGAAFAYERATAWGERRPSLTV